MHPVLTNDANKGVPQGDREMETQLYFNVPEVVLAAVKRDGRALMYASDELRDNRCVVLAAVEKSPIALTYASEELRHDSEFMMFAIKANPHAFAFAPDALRDDRTFVFNAVEHTHSSTVLTVLMCASERLQRDRDMVMHVIKCVVDEDVLTLMETWWDDLEVLLVAVARFSFLLKYAPERIRHDRATVLAAVRVEGDALSGVPDEFRDDREIVLAAVSNYGGALEYASETLRADREIVLAAVENGGDPLCYVPDHLLDDRTFILQVVTTHARYDKFCVSDHPTLDCSVVDVPERYFDDFEIVHAAVAHDGHTLSCVSDRLHTNREIVLTAVSNYGRALECASETLRNDREVVLAAVTNDGRALECASETLRNDREVVLAAVANDGYALRYASETLRNDRELVRTAVSNCGYARIFASETLRNDRELVLAAASNSFLALRETFYGDREIVLAALASTSIIRHSVGFGGRRVFDELAKVHCNDRDVMFAIVTKGGPLLRESKGSIEIDLLDSARRDGFPWWMQNDPDIICAVRCADYLRHASETLRSDRDFVISVLATSAFALQACPLALQNDRDVISAAINKDRRAVVQLPRDLRASYARAGPIETRLLFERMPYPFNLPWELVATHILPLCHRV